MRRCAGSAAEVGKHGEHARVVVVGGLQAQLEEDGRGVLGDGALGDHEPLGGCVPWSRYVPASGSRCRRSDPRNPAVAIPAGQRHLLAGPCQVGGGPHGDGQVQPGSRRPPAADRFDAVRGGGPQSVAGDLGRMSQQLELRDRPVLRAHSL